MKKYLLFLLMTLPLVFTSCGDDNDDEPSTSVTPTTPGGIKESDLLGYWLNTDESSFEAYHIQPNGTVTGLDGEFGRPAENYEYTSLWNTREVDEMMIVSVNSNTLILDEYGDGSDIIVYTKTTATVWDNLRRTATLDGIGGSQPEDPTTPTWSASDFVGVWLCWTKEAVYELKSDRSVVRYWLTTIGDADTYSVKDTGTWNYNASTAEISFRFDSYSFIETVEYVETLYGFRTNRGSWQVARVPSPDNTLLAGTKWQGRVDGISLTLEFKADGTFVETLAGERTSDTYQVLNENTLSVGGNSFLSNTFGSVVTFALSADKSRLTLSNNWERWELTRKN